MTRLSRKVFKNRCLPAALAALSIANATQAGTGGGSLPGLAEREIARRMGRVQDARIAIEQGDKLMAEGDTEGALGQYKAAMDALPNAAITSEWSEMQRPSLQIAVSFWPGSGPRMGVTRRRENSLTEL